MDFLKNVGSYVGKGFDSIKTTINSQMNKVQDSSEQSQPSLPKGVHILGVDDQPNPQQDTSNDSNANDTNSDDFNKFYYGQTSSNQPQQPPAQNKPTSSSIRDLFNINTQNYKVKGNVPDKEFMQGFNLINGEKPVEWERCSIKLENGAYPCRALLTGYRVYIIPDLDQTSANYFPEGYFSLPIHKIEKTNRVQKPQTFEFFFEIIMSDARVFSLIFKTGINENFPHILNGLLSSKETPSFSQLAYDYNRNHPIYKRQNFENGWELYDPEKEYQRQGLTNLDYEMSEKKPFRKTNLNDNYSLCETYPKFLITVGAISESNYKESSLFRTKNRLPTLSYYYYNSKGTIWRSAQAKTGISGNRNRFDEELMNAIGEISNSKKLFIYDCRPYLAAMANKLKGAGHENTENYNNAELFFCEIDNIHSARKGINSIYNILKNNNFINNKSFFSSFEKTNWPNFIFGIIQASINVASSIKNGYSVLIHCSDGWDRASQVTAFSQLLIDPYYRTIRGYMTLIEKDFVSFGHQFRYRNGYYSKEENNENQQSPILLQYLDATHQLLVQYPMYFEFNMKFLLFIANNINSGLYGTFLYNNEKERETKKAKQNTMSCWTEILNNMDEYKNCFYEKKTMEEYFFIPVFSINRIRLWEEFFFPFTQIKIGISYDEYINRWYGNYFNIFGQVKSKNSNKNRMISSVMFYEKEKEEYVKNIDKKNKEIQNLKKALAELIMKNNLKKDVYEGLSKETAEVMRNVSKENGGKIDLNDEQTEYVFKKTKNMFEGIVQSKPEENKTEEKKDTEKTESLQTLENKIKQKDQNESSESNEGNETNVSNETNEENKTNDNN
jgi:hypothetical protein